MRVMAAESAAAQANCIRAACCCSNQAASVSVGIAQRLLMFKTICCPCTLSRPSDSCLLCVLCVRAFQVLRAHLWQRCGEGRAFS